MLPQVQFRLDGDVAAVAKVRSEGLGLPMSVYVNELLRQTFQKESFTAPVYLPPGARPGVREAFVEELQSSPNSPNCSHTNRLWVLYMMSRGKTRFFLPGCLERVYSNTLVVRTYAGLQCPIAMDDLISWEEFTSDYERQGMISQWISCQVSPHPMSDFRSGQ